MKLVTFKTESSAPVQFGLLINDKVYSFKSLSARYKQKPEFLKDIYSYLYNLPESFNMALRLQNKLLKEKKPSAVKGFSRNNIILLPPVPEPAALLDFGLSPRHMVNSSRTMFRYEMPRPLSIIAAKIISRRFKKIDKNALPYYKGNHNELIGHGETTHWPSYTSYIDIEPELAFVTGKCSMENGTETVVAGYTIFNDFSARDVQFPEMTGLGPARSKDFSKSNGLGPCLVTPDETGNPLALDVSVTVGDRFKWEGSTSEYAASPEDIIRFCSSIFTIRPGTVIGMGTIPGCCGLDNDLWICPGDAVSITFNRIGTLTQHIPSKIGKIEKSRWPVRDLLKKFL